VLRPIEEGSVEDEPHIFNLSYTDPDFFENGIKAGYSYFELLKYLAGGRPSIPTAGKLVFPEESRIILLSADLSNPNITWELHPTEGE